MVIITEFPPEFMLEYRMLVNSTEFNYWFEDTAFFVEVDVSEWNGKPNIFLKYDNRYFVCSYEAYAGNYWLSGRFIHIENPIPLSVVMGLNKPKVKYKGNYMEILR